MQRYFIQLSYDGTNYHGWQIQPNGISVQETVEKALRIVARETVALTGAGRTDAGVHASFYIAHFDTDNQNLDNEKIIHNLNCLLPADIVIQKIFKVAPVAHARFDAVSRRYEYHVVTKKNVFKNQLTARVSEFLDFELMNSAAATLKEYREVTNSVQFAVEDATVIVGSVFDESMGDELRVTIVATGLGSPVDRKQTKPVLVEYEQKRTGTHDEPISVTNYKELEMPAVIRTGRHREAVEAMKQSGVETLDIPSFLRKQAD